VSEGEEHRSGYVALAGRPNVGKSTLVNALLGESILPTSPKPQTTRRKQLGILTTSRAQIIFVDTPGIHKPHHKLGEFMIDDAQEAMADADLIVAVFDASEDPSTEDKLLVDTLSRLPLNLMVLNKLDRVGPDEFQNRWSKYSQLFPELDQIIAVSATRGDNLQELVNLIISSLPIGPRYYDEDVLTDTYERDIAPDLIRAAAMRHLRQELPYSIAVRIDEYRDRSEQAAYIQATLFVERESQKGIVIGKGGSMLRTIGTDARLEIERMSNRKIFLDLRVKVYPGWRNDEEALRRFGYSRK
jgi:GTP-binding protein Era